MGIQARAYGEAEFWFSSIKVVTIVGLIILGIVLMCGGGPVSGVSFAGRVLTSILEP